MPFSQCGLGYDDSKQSVAPSGSLHAASETRCWIASTGVCVFFIVVLNSVYDRRVAGCQGVFSITRRTGRTYDFGHRVHSGVAPPSTPAHHAH